MGRCLGNHLGLVREAFGLEKGDDKADFVMFPQQLIHEPMIFGS